MREYLCRPLIGMGVIIKIIQYPSNTPKYITFAPYWIHNNLLFNIPFFVHNNIKMIIGIFSTIDLLCAVLFTYFPLERMPTILRVTVVITSLGSKNLKELSLKWQNKVQLPIAVS